MLGLVGLEAAETMANKWEAYFSYEPEHELASVKLSQILGTNQIMWSTTK